MFKTVVDETEFSSVILLKDCVEQTGRGLLKAFLVSLTKRYEVVHLVLYENSEATFSSLPAACWERLRLHNFAADPLGWLSSGSITMDTDLSSYLMKDNEQSRSAVVIDSLSSLILHRRAPYTCQTLHRLANTGKQQGSTVEQVVALVHSDLHDATCMGLLDHIATTVINVCPSSNAKYYARCQMLHKKTSGKIIRETQHLILSKEYQVTYTEDVLELSLHTDHEVPPDPTVNLTFNLTLSDREKKARSQMTLPYLHVGQNKDVGPDQSSLDQSSGKVFYQPDDDDDFDEEDPDDDLDI